MVEGKVGRGLRFRMVDGAAIFFFFPFVRAINFISFMRDRDFCLVDEILYQEFFFFISFRTLFHISDYILFFIVNLHHESFLIFYFNFHPSTSCDIDCFT